MIHVIIILIAGLLVKIGHEIFDHIQHRNREALHTQQEETHKTHEEKKDQ
jgi:hypothetical protein